MVEESKVGFVEVGMNWSIKNIIMLAELLRGHILERLMCNALDRQKLMVWSEFFDPLPEGAAIPTYDISYKCNEGNITFITDVKRRMGNND